MNSAILPIFSGDSSELADFFVLMGAMALVVIIAFFWLTVRSEKRHRHKHHRRRHRKSYRDRLQKGAGDLKTIIRERRRRRRHEHRPLNPTLAQTGGLPPIRPTDEPPPPAPKP